MFFSDRQERTYKSRWFAYSALKFLHKRKFSKNFPDGILGADNSTEVNFNFLFKIPYFSLFYKNTL